MPAVSPKTALAASAAACAVWWLLTKPGGKGPSGKPTPSILAWLLCRRAATTKTLPVCPVGDNSLSKYAQNEKTWDCSSESVKEPRCAETGIASANECEPTTIPKLFLKAVRANPDKVALRTESPCPDFKSPSSAPLNQWKSWTFQEYYDETCTVAKALMTIGVEKYDSVNIFGFNAPEWFLADLGAVFAGAKAAGIYPTDTPEQVCFKVNHSASKVVAVDTESKLQLFAEHADSMPGLIAVVVWGFAPSLAELPRKNGSVIRVYAWERFMELGKSVPDSELQARIDGQKPGEACTLIYTSGTTGFPKAVMISHDNIIFKAYSAMAQMPMVGCDDEEERIISYLPLSHVAGLMVDIVCPIVITAALKGWCSVSFARIYDLKKSTIAFRLQAVQPTVFLGVPRVWEKISEKMKALGKTIKGPKLTVSKWAKAKGLEHALACQLHGDGHYPFFYGIADKIVLSQVKLKLGLSKCKFGFTGAAPIMKSTLEYFGSLGIQINEVYGMSECTGSTTWSTDETHVWGSCGFAEPGCEVRVFKVNEQDVNDITPVPPAKDGDNPTEAEQGEICFRGRHIMMGYLANPALGEEHVAEIEKKTREAIDTNGWLHSGDKGCMDKDGMFKITGRYKELIITAGGENIAPVPIEDYVKSNCAGISNVMMVGDQRKYNTMLVSLTTVGATGELPGGDDLTGPALEVNRDVKTVSAATTDPAWEKHISNCIKAANADSKICASNAWKVQKFKILPEDFSVQTGELTPTLKLKRSVVAKKYAELIDSMY